MNGWSSDTAPIANAIAIFLAASSIPMASIGCELPRDAGAARDEVRIEASGDVRIAYRTDPSGLAVDRHFALLIRACADEPVTQLSVDAHMPDHRHGMNYKPAISRIGADAWRADGLLFHMPGKWELVFAVASAQGIRRVAHTVIVR